MRRFLQLFLWLLLLVLVGCSGRNRSAVPGTLPTAVIPTSPPATGTAIVNPILTPTPPADEMAMQGTPVAAPPSPIPTWPPPATPEAALARTAVSAAQQATFDELAHAVPPRRDDLALAIAYKGLVPPAGEGIAAAPGELLPLSVGTGASFNIFNYDNNTVVEVEMELKAVGRHAYFWFDSGPGAITPDADTLAGVALAFDEIYAQVVAAFGQENNPGIDGDPRIHIVHVSPLVLCDVTEETAGSCGLAGYFSAGDMLPAAVDARSNEREMFVMNSWNFGTDYYLNVLGHEFRHMVEHNYDEGDIDWAVEGSAVLAEELLGYTSNAYARANLFLSNPDQQLNSWTEGNPSPFYGQGYLLNHYLYHRLGADLYRQFAQSEAAGLAALDQVAAVNGLLFSGHALWLDWLVALAIHDRPGVPSEYRLAAPLDTAASTAVNQFPTSYDTDVHQYAADYYRLFGDGTVTISFTGSTLVPLLEGGAASGSSIWYAQRANYSQMRLTRGLDLREVTEASLNYAVYYDIERGYDFAYLSVSTNGGETWQGITATNMDGLDPADDPSGGALTERFYSGRERRWLQETADLTPFAGQQIQIRFEYVTDPILTYGGLALDNIAVPEIGFYDDVERLSGGWLAEGFSRVTAVMPQQWDVQLVTFPGGVATVQSLALTAAQTASISLDLSASSERPVLIVAASAPMTLQKAHYRLQFE